MSVAHSAALFVAASIGNDHALSPPGVRPDLHVNVQPDLSSGFLMACFTIVTVIRLCKSKSRGYQDRSLALLYTLCLVQRCVTQKAPGTCPGPVLGGRALSQGCSCGSFQPSRCIWWPPVAVCRQVVPLENGICAILAYVAQDNRMVQAQNYQCNLLSVNNLQF